MAALFRRLPPLFSTCSWGQWLLDSLSNTTPLISWHSTQTFYFVSLAALSLFLPFLYPFSIRCNSVLRSPQSQSGKDRTPFEGWERNRTWTGQKKLSEWEESWEVSLMAKSCLCHKLSESCAVSSVPPWAAQYLAQRVTKHVSFEKWIKEEFYLALKKNNIWV